MYKKILVPVDLAHREELKKALDTASDIAKHYQATLHFVAVASSVPSFAAHDPSELEEKLRAFADEQGRQHGVQTTHKVIVSVDPTAELEKKLVDAISDADADLVVMASHEPGLGDKLHIIRSNAADIVRHTKASVFVVR